MTNRQFFMVNRGIQVNPLTPQCLADANKIIKNDIMEREKKIVLEWKNVDGAESYEVMIYTDGSTKSTIKESTRDRTLYSRDFDTNLGFGKVYRAEIIAHGPSNMSNSQSTKEALIGRLLKVMCVESTPILNLLFKLFRGRSCSNTC